MKKNKLHTRIEQTCHFYIGSKLEAGLKKELERNIYSNCLIITDRHVYKLYGDKLNKIVSQAIPVKIKIVPQGEEAKQWQTCVNCYQTLVKNNYDRSSLIIALGGGAISDLTGFIAATYMRGIAWMIYSTTLLSQVDASIGGKTGFNFAGSKNMIGAFHQPKAVFADIATLQTLPSRQFNSGMAEVIKYAVTMDKQLVSILQEKGNLSSKRLENIISRSIELKIRIVEKDYQETTGLRQILNFGHTLGHAIESSTKVGLFTHGEAISLGMLFAAKLSQSIGLCSHQDVKILTDLLKKYQLPTELKIKRGLLLEAIKKDKKRRGKKIHWVLLNGIGRAVTDQIVEEKIIKQVLRNM